jgi:hypothetical protein
MKAVGLAILILFCSDSYGQDTIGRGLKDIVHLRGYVKNMQSYQLADLKYISHNNLVHNRLNLRLYPSARWTVGLEIRNRVFTGDQVQLNPLFRSSVDVDAGLMDLSWMWLDEPGIVGLTQMDRAWARWSNEKWDVTVGRQRINWGLNAFWNSNDLFNSFNLVDFDYEERPGSDAVRVQRYFGGQRSIEVAIAPSTFDSNWVGAGIYRFNRWTYDFQVLGGWWKEDIALGVGWAGNLRTASFKGEATYFHPQDDWSDTIGVLSTSLSLDYVFSGSLYVMGGVLYNSQGVDSTVPLSQLANSAIVSTRPPSAKYLMPTKYSLLLSVSKPITPLLGASLVAIYAPGMNLVFIMPSLSVAVANNWDFAVFAQSSMLDDGNSFRNHGTSIFARLKWGF